MEFAPDGSLYLIDWHNILIGHMQHNARDPLRDHVPVYLAAVGPKNLELAGEIADGVLLRIVESGFDALPDSHRADAFAAAKRLPPKQPAIVIDAGSAVTVDLLDESGAFPPQPAKASSLYHIAGAITEAQANGWLGEVAGLKTSRDAAARNVGRDTRVSAATPGSSSRPLIECVKVTTDRNA